MKYIGKETRRVDGVAKVTGKATYAAEFQVPGVTYGFLTPSAIADGTGDPAGFKSKVIAFAAAVEPLFALPTFANPALPVAVYLTRDESGTLYKVMEETNSDRHGLCLSRI